MVWTRYILLDILLKSRGICLDQRYPAGYPAGEEGHMVWTSKRVCFIVLSNNLYSERYNNAIIYVYETMSPPWSSP